MARDVFGLLGTTIKEQYRVDAVVGEGGFGVVYRGFHLSFEHPVAMKFLKLPHRFTEEAQKLFFEKFREEGKVLSRLSDHPSIVRVFDFGVTRASPGEGVPYLVLEWLDGKELGQVLRQRGRPFPEAEALKLLRPVIEAIALAHSLGIAHRDLKPSNLIIAQTQRGEMPKVLDFGISKAMQEGETATRLATETSSGFHAFSPQYGAPEQFRSKKYGPTGPWTDVHAIGLILTELTSGRPAYEGEEQADFYEASMLEKRPTPRSKGARASDGFEALCAKALALMPKDRFPDAGQLLVAMDAIRGITPEAPTPAARAVSAPESSQALDPIALASLPTMTTPAARAVSEPESSQALDPIALASLPTMTTPASPARKPVEEKPSEATVAAAPATTALAERVETQLAAEVDLTAAQSAAIAAEQPSVQLPPAPPGRKRTPPYLRLNRSQLAGTGIAVTVVAVALAVFSLTRAHPAAAPPAATASGSIPGELPGKDQGQPGASGVAAKAEGHDATMSVSELPLVADPGRPGSAADKAASLRGNAATPAPGEAPPSGSVGRGSDVPEVPSESSIQGAIGAVMGAARACVAGMAEPSRAQVTFVSSGSVVNVSVSGAADGKPAAGCIVAALRRANVGPFLRPSYLVGVTIRP